MKTNTAIGAICVSMLLLSSANAYAWWDMGHMEIAATAYERLDQPIRDKVDALIRLNPSYPDWVSGIPDQLKAEVAFARAAVWADDIKNDPTFKKDKITDADAGENSGYQHKLVHDFWHYIDIPFTTDETPVEAPAVPNALTQIEAFTVVLGSNADDRLKSYDLVWLLHLVGDIHQPLHATARYSSKLGGDRGGNFETVQTTGGEKMKLHAFWDGRLGSHGSAIDAISATHNLPPPDPARASVTDPALWLIESFTIAQNDVYTPLIGDGEETLQLTTAYEDHALRVASQQASVAGARLANLINASLK